MPGRGAVRISASPSRAMARFSPTAARRRRPSRSSPGPPGERGRRPPGSVASSSWATLKATPLPARRAIGVGRVGPVRVDERERRGQDRRDAVVVGDDDVDAALARPRRSRRRSWSRSRPSRSPSRRRATRRVDRGAATGRGPRRAGSARTASTATPKRRSASVMMASPVRPSASKSPKTRTRSPPSRARVRRSSSRSASGSSRGSCRPSSGSREPAATSARSSTPRRGEQRRQPVPRPRAAPLRRSSGVARHALRKDPAEPGFDHGVRMPEALHPGSPAGRVTASGCRAPDPRGARRASGR